MLGWFIIDAIGKTAAVDYNGSNAGVALFLEVLLLDATFREASLESVVDYHGMNVDLVLLLEVQS